MAGTKVKQMEARGTQPPTSSETAGSDEPALSAKTRAQNKVLRVLESKRAGGFKTVELAMLVSALVLPLVDTTKDWSFTVWLGTSHGTLSCPERMVEPCADCALAATQDDVDGMCQGVTGGRAECLAHGCCFWGEDEDRAEEMHCFGNPNRMCADRACACEEWANAKGCGLADAEPEVCVDQIATACEGLGLVECQSHGCCDFEDGSCQFVGEGSLSRVYDPADSSHVSHAMCTDPSAAVVTGDAHWFVLADAGQSCTEKCSSLQRTCDLAGTRAAISSRRLCFSVILELGLQFQDYDWDAGDDTNFGCVYMPHGWGGDDPPVAEGRGEDTTCEVKDSSGALQRVCACDENDSSTGHGEGTTFAMARAPPCWERSVENCQRSCFEHLPENSCVMEGEARLMPTLCEHHDWFVISLAIQFASGFVCGLELGRTHFHESLGLPRWQAMPLGILVGLPGLTCVAMAGIALYKRDARQGARNLKKMKVLEFLVETFPQTTFQAYVSIMQAQMQSLLLLSILLGLLSAGAATFGLEGLQRGGGEGLRLSTFSRYGIVKILHNASLMTLMVFSVSLLAVEYRVYAVIPMVVFIGLLLKMVQGGQRLRVKGCLAASFVVFWSVLGVSTAVIRESMGTEQKSAIRKSMGLGYVKQSEVNVIFDALNDTPYALYGWIFLPFGSWLLLSTIAGMLDPETGHSGLRDKSWAERVAKDSEGMSEWSILQAKAEAIWRWADVFRDGKLEEAEIERLKEATECSCDSVFEALRNEASGLLDQRRFTQVCHEDGEQVAAWFSALKLELVDSTGCAEKVVGALLGVVPNSDAGDARERIVRTTSAGGNRHRHVLAAMAFQSGSCKHITPVPVAGPAATDDQLNARYKEQSEVQVACGLVVRPLAIISTI